MTKKDNQRIPQKGTPLYQQVASWLRDDIAHGVYPVGALLPTTLELAEIFNVGKHTVRKALDQLKNGGMVSIRRRGGTRVEANLPETSEYVIQAFDSITQYSNKAKLKVLNKDLIIARRDVAELLQCPSAQEWLHVEGYRAAGDSSDVVGYMEIFINAGFPKVYERINKNTVIVFKMFEEVYGERIVEVRQEMKAVHIKGRAAEVLGVCEGAVGMRYITRFLSMSGVQLEVSVNIHPLDKLDFAQNIIYPRPIN